MGTVLQLIQIYHMTTNTSIDSYFHEDKRNIKNIYVHKINSLMKLSKDTLLKEDLQSSHNPEKKKFKKTQSTIDKTTLKLQKNRESAKKARLRKKIYIKMLESQIECFKKLKTEGDQLNEQLQTFLASKSDSKKDIEMNELITHDINVDKFLSGSDLGQVMKIENQEFEKKLKERDGIIEELYQLSTSSLIKKLKGSKNFQVFHPILKKQARENTASFETLIKRISHNYDIVKNSFRKIHELTEKSKKISRNCRNNGLQTYEMGKFMGDLISVQEFMQKLDLNRESEFIESVQKKPLVEETNGYTLGMDQKSGQNYNDFNLCATQKLIIRAEKFFQHTFFEEEQNEGA